MVRRPLLQLLAAVWLILGQCALVVHATDHELDAKAKPCQLCTSAHAFASPPAAAQVAPPVSVLAVEVITGTRPAAGPFRFARPYHTGPPHLGC